MILNESIAKKVEAIHHFVKNEGTLTPGSLVDRWEFKGVRTISTDGGYGIQIGTDIVSVWADLGCNQTGFFRGTEIELDNLLLELGIAAQ
jgi:hypothetical protein